MIPRRDRSDGSTGRLLIFNLQSCFWASQVMLSLVSLLLELNSHLNAVGYDFPSRILPLAKKNDSRNVDLVLGD